MERRRHYYLLIYHVPTKPTAARVGIWRDLKRLGVLYLQQSVCIVPAFGPVQSHLVRVTERITALSGGYHLLPIRSLPAEEEKKIINGFVAQSNAQYEEIIESCAVNFTKEIEFETFRQNFTYAEAEEIRQDLDKIRRWYERVVERDWFAAPRRPDAQAWIARCEELLDGFEERVFAVQRDDVAEVSEQSAGTPLPLGPVKGRRGSRERSSTESASYRRRKNISTP